MRVVINGVRLDSWKAGTGAGAGAGRRIEDVLWRDSRVSSEGKRIKISEYLDEKGCADSYPEEFDLDLFGT